MDPEDTLTAAQWWEEWEANACCPDASTAARRLCGCGGSGQVPASASRLLIEWREGDFTAFLRDLKMGLDA